jgi:hypothetical protein
LVLNLFSYSFLGVYFLLVRIVIKCLERCLKGLVALWRSCPGRRYRREDIVSRPGTGEAGDVAGVAVADRAVVGRVFVRGAADVEDDGL